jgi:murein DD-endopeptidase MepM/ murein hydrolase activator NlpD
MPSFQPRVYLILLAVAILIFGLFHVIHQPIPDNSTSFLSLLTPSATPSGPVSEATVAPSNVSPIPAQPLQTQLSLPTTQTATEADVFDLKRLRDLKALAEVHKVEDGENWWSIASDDKIDVPTLIGGNPTLPMKARINRPVVILSERGSLHTVRKGETLSSIAAFYKSDSKILQKVNGIQWWWWARMKVGDVLFIPGAKPLLMAQEWQDYFAKRGIFGDPLGRWGVITSPFGKRYDPLNGDIRHHSGLDLRAKYGDSVYAAAGGRIIFTGISGGYGNLIQIAHGNGFITLYGHLSKIFIQQGQKVRRGQLIGKVGATGRVTGPHLHFEIRKNGKAVDPLPYI